jgi:hypothetical protein
VAIEGNFQDILRDIKMFIDFKILKVNKVKVPIIFSGMHGFPARRDRRYPFTTKIADLQQIAILGKFCEFIFQLCICFRLRFQQSCSFLDLSSQQKIHSGTFLLDTRIVYYQFPDFVQNYYSIMIQPLNTMKFFIKIHQTASTSVSKSWGKDGCLPSFFLSKALSGLDSLLFKRALPST